MFSCEFRGVLKNIFLNRTPFGDCFFTKLIHNPYIKTRSSSKTTKKIIKAKTLQVNEKSHIHRNSDVYLRPCQTSMVQLFLKTSYQLKNG